MNIWVAVMSTVAVMLLFGIPAMMLILFRPQRARYVKHAERQTAIVVQQRITELAVYHPEIVKRPRLDRHPFYIGAHVGVVGYAVCVLAGADITSNVASLTLVTRYTIGVCFIVGATFALTGTMLGSFLWRWRVAGRVHDHPTAPLLGDDITLPYWLGVAGLACVTVSAGIYASTSFQTTAGSLGGWLAGCALAGPSMWTAWLLYQGIRHFERDESILMSEVMSRIEREKPCH